MTKKIVKRRDANNETLYFYTHSDAVDVGEGRSTKSLTEVIDDTLHKSAQTLTNAEKTQVHANLGTESFVGDRAVRYDEAQVLGSDEKTQALTNLGLNGVDEYPTKNSTNMVRSGGVYEELALGTVYDVSAKNPTAGPNNDGKWESLSALLSDANLNTLIPTAVRKGGMSVKYVQTSDNKYIRYNLIADEFTTDTTQWAIDDVGVYVENPEFVYVKTDKENKILWAIKKDGGIFYGAGVPSQVVNYINEKIAELSLDEYEDIVAFLDDLEKGDKTLQTLLNEKVDKEEGKSLIDAEYASSQSAIDNPEFLEVTTDSEGKVLEGIQVDGTKVIGGNAQIVGNATVLGNIDIQGTTYALIQSPEWIRVIVDKQQHILCGIKTDGSIYLNSLAEIPSVIQDAINDVSNYTTALEERILAIESIFHIVDNPEYITVETDNDGKILSGRNVDGAKFENLPMEFKDKVSVDGNIIENIKDIEERIEIKTDSKHRIIAYRDKDGVLHEEAGIMINHLGLSFDATQELINALNALGYTANNPADWSDSEFVEIPIPSVCAIVNIETGSQAEAKGVDIPTHIQFWDRAGNYFRKPIVLNAQGSSSMSYHIKNQAIDFTDGSEIKFGNWIPCDSFHIKKYFIDVFRGQCIVGYWLTEQVYQTRPYGERRPWDYLNSFNDVNNSNGSFGKDYATGALAHPDGFPVKVFFNGKNSGIYAFNLKKDRSNYYCKKDKQKQVILDGILGSTFWMANGDLTQPGEDGGNIWHDFEVRNPKISKDINGDKYDGDNPKEPSDNYATTKAAIERLTTAITLVNAESTTEAKKTKFEEFFNVPFLIDYDLIGQVIYNNDGYRKNWIWITNDGNKWCPTSYDMDSIFGQHWNGASYLPESITTILGTNNNIPTGTNLLKGLYQTEMRGRYKELRDSGIFSVDNIVGLLEKWVNACGYNNLKEDIEEVVTSPYMENGVIVVDGEGKQVLIPNTPSYRDGTKEYAYPPTSGGWYNSILRVKNWLTQRIQTLDTYYNYTNN